MQIGELVTAPSLAQEMAAKCPFRDEEGTGPANAPEDIADDDKAAVQGKQSNDGGLLGQNLEAGRAGQADGGPFPADDFVYRQPANDSKRGRLTRLRMLAYRDAAAGDFPISVAAHHLIPGNASLYSSELVNYMEDGKSVRSMSNKSYTIEGYIGYDVNGSHNGVWLPGNYAIKTALPERRKDDRVLPAREGTTPVEGVSWRALSTNHEEWQFAYVAGACKAGGGQFHDTHSTPYSSSVKGNLQKITIALATHLDTCEECKDKSKVPPPFRVKRRLHAVSARLREYLMGPPEAWKRPWFTSERWCSRYFGSGGKVTPEFRRAYAAAAETHPHVVPRL
jgi:hypothetical protein